MNLRHLLIACASLMSCLLTAQGAIEINWTMGGAVLKDGSTAGAPVPVDAGVLIQLIWAGPDDLANPPNSSAGPNFTSGDDVILATTNFVMMGGFSQPTIQRQYNIPGSSLADQTFVYARVFDVSDPNAGDCKYFDTPLIEAQEQTDSDAINADVLDMTSVFDFRTAPEFGNIPVVVTDLTCSSDPSQCAVLDLQSSDDNGTGSGTATVTAMGIGPFRYAWDAAAGGQTTPTATGLAAGNYCVVVTDLGNGSCTVTGCTDVANGLGFMLDLTASPCPSANGGVAEVVNISGAAGSVSISWDVPASASTNNTIASDLPPGNYSVTVRDGAGNSAMQPFEITATFADIDFVVTGTDPECGTPLGGSATVSAITGGSGSYVIQWDAAASSQTTLTANSLAAGTYSVTVTDTGAAGCGVTKQVTLSTNGDAPIINCITTFTINDCPQTAAAFDAQAAGLATDGDGTALPPVGLTVITDNSPCTLVVDYTFSVTNDCAVSTCVSRVTFQAGPPTIGVIPASLQDMTLACLETLPLPNTNDLASVFSNCGDLSVQIDQENPSTTCRSNLDPAKYIFTATDSCGGTVAFTQNFTWAADTTPPTVAAIAPRDIAGCSGVPTANSTVVSATDDCNSPPVITLDGDSTRLLGDGRTELTRTWRVADACGNATTVDEVITFVNDSTAPVFDTLPQNFDVSLTADDVCTFTIPDFVNNPPAGFNPITFSDGASGVVVTQNVAAGTVITSPGTMTILVFARNACGNESSSAINLNLLCGSADPGSISGQMFQDRNANGRQENRPDEGGISGSTIYIDANNNGMLDDFETSVTTDAMGNFTFPDLAPGIYRIRAIAPDGINLTSPLGGSHIVNLAAGEGVTGLLFGGQGGQEVQGTVWQDVDMNGIPDENLNALGIGGAQINLYIVIDGTPALIGMATTGGGGSYTFRNLAPGFTYELEIIPASITVAGSPVIERQFFTYEADGDRFSAFQSDAGGSPIAPPTVGTPGSFALMAIATAIELVRFEAIGDLITWETAWEENTLGFFVYRVVGDAEPVRVNDTLVLPRGATHGAIYSVTDANPPAAGEATEYILLEIETDLEENEHGPATLVHAASPQGEPVAVIESDAGNVSLRTDADTLSYLVIGLNEAITLEDVTDPENRIPLKGEVLETDAGTGIYFSWPAGRSIESP